MATTFNTIPTKRLAATISGSSAYIKLNNILGWDGADLTPAYLGDVLYAVLRDQDNSVIEIMQLDPTTIANNSTTGITITRRGLKFNGDLTTEVPANKLVWVKNQTIVEIGTDVPQIFQNFVNFTDAQSIGGVKTFTSLPATTAGNPVAANDLARKAYVDAVGTGSATYDQEIISGTAGETLVSGDLVYFKMSDQRWWKTDADASATSIDVKIGLSQGSASAGASVNVLTGGLAKNLTGLTAGTAYFVSGTAGAVSSTRGTFVRFVGRAVSTTSMFFDANNVIETMTQSMNQIYGASTTGNDTYVVTLAPAPAAYTNGMMVNFKPDTANTGAATLNVNGLGAKTIKKNFNTDLIDNDIKVNQIVTVVYESTTDTFQMQSQVANTAPPVTDVQAFTTAGTTSWTKPTGAKYVEVTVIGGGGAGGSGTPVNNVIGGGGGGWGYKRFDASALGATETIVVGAGGVAGANNTAGGSGGYSAFGTTVLLRADGGTGGSGTGTAAGGSANGDIHYAGGNSGTSYSGAGVSTSTDPSPRGGGSGGYNGGSPATATAGGAGGGFTTYYVLAGGTAGAAGVNNGGAGNSPSTGYLQGGTGGGGGGYNGNGTNTGGNGGAGAFPGGGGGGSVGTNNVGGNGAKGMVYVVTYF